MEDPSANGVATVLRSMQSSRVADEPLSSVLLESAEDALFQRVALAPPRIVAARAVRDFQDAGPVNASDDVAHADWLSALTVVIDSFEMDATAALKDGCKDFSEACGRVFGIEASTTPALLATFHALEEAQRVGVFLGIEQTPPFAYLQRQIDAAPDDTPFVTPDLALRELLRRTFILTDA